MIPLMVNMLQELDRVLDNLFPVRPGDAMNIENAVYDAVTHATENHPERIDTEYLYSTCNAFPALIACVRAWVAQAVPAPLPLAVGG